MSSTGAPCLVSCLSHSLTGPRYTQAARHQGLGFISDTVFKTDYSNISDLMNESQVQLIISGLCLGISLSLITQSDHAQLIFALTNVCNQIGNLRFSSVIIMLIHKICMISFHSVYLICTPTSSSLCFSNGNFSLVLQYL